MNKFAVTKIVLGVAVMAVAPLAWAGSGSAKNNTIWQGTAGTTPQSAGDWWGEGNWSNGTPNDKTFNAKVNALSAGAYLSFGEAVTLGQITGATSGFSNGPYIIGDTMTFDNPTYDYNICGGALFCDLATVAGHADGTLSDTQIAGRIRFGSKMFIHASGTAFHRLDLYATSSEATRTNDFECAGVYHGSGSSFTLAPTACAAHEEGWVITPGSPFVTRTTASSAKTPGALVTCGDVFPEGTFVKRIFNSTALELSAPASETAEAGEQTISFAAITPVTRITIPEFRICTYYASTVPYLKQSAADDVRIDILKLTSNSAIPSTIVFANDYANNYVPATVVIHDAAPGNSTTFGSYCDRILWLLCNEHIEFAATGREGAESGLPASTMTTRNGNTSYSTEITVPEGIAASVGQVTNFVSTIVKTGTGSLKLGLTNNVSRNTGKLDIRAGKIILPKGAWVKNVKIASGATLEISDDFAPTTLTVEEGACITGTGTLTVPTADYASKLICAPTVTLRILQGNSTAVVQPEFKVVGNPAFWVDATNRATMTFKDNDGVNVTRLNDVRKKSDDDGYMFATNLVECPTMKQIGGVDAGIYFTRVSGTLDATKVHELFWSEPITNICAVFQVVDVRGGGGQFLGSSERLHKRIGRTNDFQRDVNAGWSNDIFFRDNGTLHQKAVLNGDVIINGEKLTLPSGYLYAGGGFNIKGSTDTFAPQVCEVVPTMPVAADTFSYDWGNGSIVGRNGTKLFCELIVYTNTLTRMERIQISGYLMKKWVGCEIAYEEVNSDAIASVNLATAPAYDVPAGQNLTITSVVGTGTFAKKGAGTAYVQTLPTEDIAGLDIAGGTLEVRTADTLPATQAELPTGMILDMDASDTTTYPYDATTKEVTGGWKSLVGSKYWYTYNKAATVTNHPCGRQMLDLGAPKYGYSTDGRAFSFLSAASTNVRSMFLVEDTAQGGTTLFGNMSTYSNEGAMRGNWMSRWYEKKGEKCFLPSDPLIAQDLSYTISDIWKKSRIRLNGARVDPVTTGFTGGLDILSAVGYNRMATDCFASNEGHGRYQGGGVLGEYILYERALSPKEVKKVEGYLSKKWRGTTPAAFAATQVGSVAVASGATLKVTGETPLMASSITGAGTIEGDVTLSSAANIVVTVNDDGTITPLTFSGAIDLSQGGTVSFAGAYNKLASATYCIAQAGTLTMGSGAWSVTKPASGHLSKCALTLSSADNKLYLTVKAPGTIFYAR